MGEPKQTPSVEAAPSATASQRWKHLTWLDYLHGLAWINLYRLIFGLRISGREHVPRSGAVLWASNHPSFADPPVFVALAVVTARRPIAFMAWDALFKIGFLKRFIERYGAYPVNIEKPGRKPYETMLRVLREGGMAGIFPEGGRSHGHLMDPLKGGALRAAASTGATILPISIVNQHDAWPRDIWLPRLWGGMRVIFHPPHALADLAERQPGEPEKAWLARCETRLLEIIEAPVRAELERRAKLRIEHYRAVTGPEEFARNLPSIEAFNAHVMSRKQPDPAAAP